MKIQAFHLKPYEFYLKNGSIRKGSLIQIVDKVGNNGWGDIAPLPNWSKETLQEALQDLEKKKETILAIDWQEKECLEELNNLSLHPSSLFGLESALYSLLTPITKCPIMTSSLLMGSCEEILAQAEQREREGYTSVKLKVGSLNFDEAFFIIDRLKNVFSLRIDVNRAWETEEALNFFSQFPLDSFDYVEEPFQNPQDLALFTHPLAIDESFPESLSLLDLENLPKLKTLVYKPTLQGGMTKCMSLHRWAKARGVTLVLSSSFESDIGLTHIASMAHRLSLKAPIGIGTHHFSQSFLRGLSFTGPLLHVNHDD